MIGNILVYYTLYLISKLWNCSISIITRNCNATYPTNFIKKNFQYQVAGKCNITSIITYISFGALQYTNRHFSTAIMKIIMSLACCCK